MSSFIGGGLIGAQGPQGDNPGSQGFQGAQGRQGRQGWQGAQGYQGDVGDIGSQGWQGWQGTGAQGYQGNTGGQGSQGWQDAIGRQGSQGWQGTGAQGYQGDQGWQGTQGPQGWQGTQGAQGDQGWQGISGIQGSQGDQGWQGVQSVQGPQGNQGWQGTQGSQGRQGNQGLTGDQGNQGWQGIQGVQGQQGNQGWQGWQGTGAQGYQGNQGWQGIQGTQGGQGWQGFQGMGVVGLPTSCQIFNTTAITVQQSDGIKPITCNSETIDTETMHSTVTNTSRITIPANKSGYYEIGYAVDTYFPLNGYYAITAIYKNGIVTLIQGTEQKVAQDTPAMTQGMAASTVVYLSGGDYIQLCASTSDVSGNLSISTASGGGVYCFKLDPGVQGSQGYQGDIGVQGIIGPQGLNPGAQGAQGPQDSVGQQGVQGWQGTGAQGYQGWQGLEGLQGRQGWQGWQGTGAQGYQGEQGLQGEQGIQGAQSVQGPQGNQGWQGIQGISGQQGNQGWQGIQGWQGDGAQGPQGINPGPQGDAGSQGVQGINGAQGNQGILGPQGSGIVGAATACQIYNTLGVPVQQSDGIKPMTCDLESIDTDTMHSIVTNTARITIPAGKSGYYEIGYAVDVYYPVAMRTVFLGMYLNGIVNQIRGTEQRVTQDSSAITQGVAASTVVLLNAGDYIQLCASTDDVTNWVSVMLHNGGGVYCFKLDPGVQGTTGVQGNQGWQGRQGNQGWQGNQGCEGWQGIQGLQGEQGAQGWQGWQGTGAQGYQGLQGEQGAQGWQGWQGTGAQGYQGWQGWQDAQGRQGDQGWQGWQGEGAQGPQGINPGPQGAQGSVGSQGVGVIGAATACQIYNSTAISVQNSDGIKAITCNSETIDTDTMHSLLTNTSRIVIPAGKSGYYALGYAVDVYFPLNGYYAVLAMYKNGLVTVVQGTKQKVSQDTPTITQGMSASTVVYLAAGEYVQLGASTSDVSGNLAVTTSDGGGVYCFKLDPGVQGPQGDIGNPN